MSLPVLDKTWQFNCGQFITETVLDTIRRNLLFAIKNSLITFAQSPWTVVRSCNSLTVAASDLWLTEANVIWGTAANVKSWIILQQTGLGTGTPQLCISCCSAPGWTKSSLQMYFSPSAGFVTGGTTTARPTASDEMIVTDNSASVTAYVYWDGWSVDSTLENRTLSVMQSTDGQCTRIIITQRTVVGGFYVIDKSKNPIAEWTYPIWTKLKHASTNTWGDEAHSGAFLENGSRCRATISGATRNLTMLVQGRSATALTNTNNLEKNPSSFDRGLLFQPMTIACNTSPTRGIFGEVFDMWIGTQATNEFGAFAGLYPADGSKQFIQLNGTILPWDGTTILRRG